MTLLGVLAAGLLFWVADQVIDPERSTAPTTWDYWGWLALCAAAGLVLALSQLLGGWTKWGWPRVSGSVFVLAFLPALVLGGWVLASYDLSQSWLQEHLADWNDDLGIDGLVQDLGGGYFNLAGIAVVIGLVLGFTLDTSGPRPRRGDVVVEEEPAPPPVAGGGFAPPTHEETVVRDERDTRVTPPETEPEAQTGIVRPDDAEPPRRVE